MKAQTKAGLFLLILTLLDFIFRKGFIAHFIPSPLPANINVLLLFTLFAISAWYVTKRFIRSDNMDMSDLGISTSERNIKEFLIGFLVGMVLWGIVSISQSLIAGFSWVIRPDFNAMTLVHGLLFIFIADLGTELYMRCYPLIKLEERYTAMLAIVIMASFELLKGLAFNFGSELLLYIVLIPILHTIFFSIIYFKTKRLGASLGVHVGANFITISIFDLREELTGQAIPSGIFKASRELESLSVHALQIPWVIMAALFCLSKWSPA